MRNIKIALLASTLLTSAAPALTYGQQLPSPAGRTYKAEAVRELEITTSQTTILLFDAAINNYDRGSSDVIVKTLKGIDNVLRVKAYRPALTPTNLTVYTSDGHIYPFFIHYRQQPATMITSCAPEDKATPQAHFSNNRLNDDSIGRLAEKIASLPPRSKRPAAHQKGGMHLYVSGIYLQDGVLFIQFTLRNLSSLPYNIDFTRFFVRDRQRSKKTINIEKEVKPLLLKAEEHSITQQGPAVFVAAFEKFTIADKKTFTIQVYEKSGDRQLTCNIKGKRLLKVHVL
jgi:conjugative transposon TraN protein